MLAIWKLCDGKKTTAQMVEVLAKKSKMKKEKVTKAVSEILGQLEKIGLVSKSK